MGSRKPLMIWVLVGLWLLAWGGQELEAAPAKLNQVVYITLSKACGCVLERCQAGDRVVEMAFTGDRLGLLKRLDYSTNKDAARQYIKKYKLSIPPSLLFLDPQGNLLWRADGELDYDQVVAKLKEFGA